MMFRQLNSRPRQGQCRRLRLLSSPQNCAEILCSAHLLVQIQSQGKDVCAGAFYYTYEASHDACSYATPSLASALRHLSTPPGDAAVPPRRLEVGCILSRDRQLSPLVGRPPRHRQPGLLLLWLWPASAQQRQGQHPQHQLRLPTMHAREFPASLASSARLQKVVWDPGARPRKRRLTRPRQTCCDGVKCSSPCCAVHARQMQCTNTPEEVQEAAENAGACKGVVRWRWWAPRWRGRRSPARMMPRTGCACSHAGSPTRPTPPLCVCARAQITRGMAGLHAAAAAAAATCLALSLSASAGMPEVRWLSVKAAADSRADLQVHLWARCMQVVDLMTSRPTCISRTASKWSCLV